MIQAFKSPNPVGVKNTIHTSVRKTSSSPLEVLLLDANQRQTLASMRVYGLAGIKVGAVAGGSVARFAPSFQSCWCSLRAIVPDFSSQADAYVTSLLALIDKHQVKMLLPAHDGSIEVLRARRSEIEDRVFLPLARESALDIVVSKTRTMQLARQLGLAVPRSIEIDNLDDTEAALKEVGCPAVIKPVQSWATLDGSGSRLSSVSVLNLDQAKAALFDLFSAGGRAVVQEWLPGRREAVSLFYVRGRFWAKFAQISHREWPVLGGASVLCESIPLLKDITEASECLVEAINLEGCSMVEFRRDREGRPCLMEINPRMAGSVALAISCGVNFPRLIYDWASGEPFQQVLNYRTGRTLRWLAGDIWNLKDTFDFQGQPDCVPPGQALTTFFTDFVRHPYALDMLELNDFRPGFVEMRGVVLNRIINRIQAKLMFVGKRERKG